MSETLTFPAEPIADGTQVTARTDGWVDGAVWERVAVTPADPPKRTRRWRLIEPPTAWLRAGHLDVTQMSYRRWPDLCADVLAGSHMRASLTATPPGNPLDAPEVARQDRES